MDLIELTDFISRWFVTLLTSDDVGLKTVIIATLSNYCTLKLSRCSYYTWVGFASVFVVWVINFITLCDLGLEEDH